MIDPSGDEREYPHGWYGLLPSSRLGAGELRPVDFLNGRVVVFRQADGSPAALGAYCCHMGADLSVGTMCDDRVRCAFHHWEFDGSGRCVSIPAASRIPRRARQYAYPVVEALGLIWAHNGGDTLYEVPHFRGHEGREFVFQVADEALHLPVEPATVVANALDVQHIQTLHGMTLVSEPVTTFGDQRATLDLESELPNIGRVVQRSTVFGTSTLTMSGGALGLDVHVVAAGTPTPDGGSRFWFVAAAAADLPEVRRRGLLRVGMQSIRAFVEQDRPVLESIRFRQGVLIEADQVFARFLRYLACHPSGNPGQPWLR